MPEDGNGWYTNWWNDGKRGGPAWEDYVLDTVLPTIQQRYKIRPERRYHAIAGLSMGGLGATFLGGRLPGYFGSVASISGFLDQQLAPGITDAMAVVSSTAPPNVLGPDSRFYASGHNPTKLVANLAHARLYVNAGSGLPDDRGATDAGALATGMAEEGALIRPMTEQFVAAARTAGLDLTYEPDNGLHEWKYFRDQFRKVLAWGLFKPVDEDPTSWVNDTVANHGDLWGYGYRFEPAPDGVVRFRRSGDTLSVAGAHSAVTVTTPGGCTLTGTLPLSFALPTAPCRTLKVTLSRRTVPAGRATRITVHVQPASAPAVVAYGKLRRSIDASGKAVMRVRIAAGQSRRLTVRADGYRARTLMLRARR